MDVMQGEDITCQHGNYTYNVTGYGRASHGLGGDGVLPTSWMCLAPKWLFEKKTTWLSPPRKKNPEILS
jgi:hypothetical protein